jgi:hypothetical protein
MTSVFKTVEGGNANTVLSLMLGDMFAVACHRARFGSINSVVFQRVPRS